VPKPRTFLINGAFLEDRIARLGLKHWWVAEQSGVDERTLRRWIHGQVKRAQQENLRALARCLGCPEGELVVQREEDYFATAREQVRAAELIEEQDLIRTLAPSGNWSMFEGIVKAVMSPRVPLPTLARLYNLLSVSTRSRNDPEAALKYGRRALEIAERAGSRLLLAQSQESVAAILSSWKGQRAEARKLLGEAQRAYRALRIPLEEARSTQHLAYDYNFAGDRASAVRLLRKAIRLADRSGDRVQPAIARSGLAMVLWMHGQYAGSRKEAEAALRMARDTGHQTIIHRVLLYLSHCRALDGNLAAAERDLAQARAWFRSTNP
jgi:tetratricopeptide (TPR) repeat protein